MAVPRAVVVQLWSGAQVVQRLGPDDADPSAEELEAIAVAFTPVAGGVRPAVRVIERAPSLRSSGAGGAAGPAGTMPR